MQLHLLTALGNTRSIGKAEEFLQTHGENRWVFTVVQANVRAGGHRQMRRCPFVQALGQWPRQQIAQDRGQIQGGEMAQPRDLAQVWLQPVFQGRQQRFVPQVRPFALPLFVQIKLT